MKAIILAAGQGKRLKPITDKTPKCLLNVGGKTILEWQLDNLAGFVDEVIIVTGFMDRDVCELIMTRDNKSPVKIVYNNEYESTNNSYSLNLALKDMDEPFYLLNGDVVFHSDILLELFKSKHKNTLAVSHKEMGEEEMQIWSGDFETVEKIGKNIGGYYEFTGIALFRDIAPVKEAMQKVYSTHWFESGLDGLKNLHYVDIGGIPYIEIDFITDYYEACEMFRKGDPDWEIGIRHGSDVRSALALNLIVDLRNELDKNGIVYWLNWGLLLGAIRDKGFIPWDTDLDITCHMRDKDKVLKLVDPVMKRLGCFIPRTERCFPEDHWFIRDKEKIELNFIEDCGDKYVYSPSRCRLACPKEFIDSLDEVEIYGEKFKIPSNAEEYLRLSYGDDWRTPIRDKKPVSL